MKSPAIAYQRPDTVEEILAALDEHRDDAKVLAGGQSLVPVMNLRLSAPGIVVDLGGIAAFRAATAANGSAWYGAMVTHARVEDLIVPDPTDGLLPRVAQGIGYRAIRNRGTVVGSLVHADPSAEWPVVLSAVDAVVRVRSVDGDHRLPVRALYRGHFTTVLEPHELVTGVEIPRLPEGATWGVHKHNRKVGEFAESLAIAIVTRDDDRQPVGATIWLGAATDVPVAVPDADGLVRRGRAPELDAIQERLLAVLPAPADAEARYRTHLHGVSIRRALSAALDQEVTT